MSSKNSGISFKSIRIFILLFILFLLGGNTWLTRIRTTDWDLPLWVTVYPVNGDGSRAAANYIDFLTESEFDPIEDFLKQEVNRYHLPLDEPFTIELYPEITKLPPKPPLAGNMLAIMWWSLRMRYWVYKVHSSDDSADIRLFLVFHDPEQHNTLRHSYGLQKGLFGAVNVFACKSMMKKNNVITTHELLHTVGAVDKYNLQTDHQFIPTATPSRAAFRFFRKGRLRLWEAKFPFPNRNQSSLQAWMM
jgi:hypothetical protein